MALNVLMENGFEDELDATFGDEEVTYDQLMQIGRKLFLAVYAQKHSLTLTADKRFGVIN